MACFCRGFEPYVYQRVPSPLEASIEAAYPQWKRRFVCFIKQRQQQLVCHGGTTMKMSHRLRSHSAGPVWGLILGLFLMFVGIGLWIYAKSMHPGSRLDESLAMATIVIGVFLTVYAGRELRHRNG